MRLRPVLSVAVLVGLNVLAVPTAHAAAPPLLQPGAYSQSDGAGCTLNFVYDGLGAQAGKVFMGTAAHCVTAVGRSVADEVGAAWGRVALIGNADATATDYAFVEVLSGHLGRVSPGMKGHTNLPTGVTTSGATHNLEKVRLSGYGLGFDLTAATREKRIGELKYDDPSIYTVFAPIIYGDSGGPVVYVPTGQALGIVSRLCIGACTEEGPTVEGLLAKAAARGFTVRLRRA